MPTPTICIDASVVVRLITNRADRPAWAAWANWQAKSLLVVAPRLLAYEVANAVYQQQRQQRITAETAAMLLKAALALPIELQDGPALHTTALDLATRFALPATYDAHYLAVAQAASGTLWTADRRLATATAAQLPWVRLLEPADA